MTNEEARRQVWYATEGMSRAERVLAQEILRLKLEHMEDAAEREHGGEPPAVAYTHHALEVVEQLDPARIERFYRTFEVTLGRDESTRRRRRRQG